MQLGGSIASVRTESGPFLVTIVDQDGSALSATTVCSVTISEPGYVDGASKIAGGQLVLDPRGVGTSTVTIEHPNGITFSFDVTVSP